MQTLDCFVRLSKASRPELDARAESKAAIEEFVNQNIKKLNESAQKDDQKPDQKAAIYLSAGSLAGLAGLDEAADGYYRQLTELVPKGYIVWANWLVSELRSNKDPARAVQLCLDASKTDQSSLPAITVTRVLLMSGAKIDAADVQRAEKLISDSLAAKGSDENLLFSIATLRIMQGRNSEATEPLRRLVAGNPRHVLALNNLAMLLGESPQTRDEALKYVDQAIAVAGRNPEMLDTKGWILYQEGKFAEAEALFSEAVSFPPADPRHLFHLALAEHRAKRMKEAREALASATNGPVPLSEETLTPAEQKELSQLKSALQ